MFCPLTYVKAFNFNCIICMYGFKYFATQTCCKIQKPQPTPSGPHHQAHSLHSNPNHLPAPTHLPSTARNLPTSPPIFVTKQSPSAPYDAPAALCVLRRTPGVQPHAAAVPGGHGRAGGSAVARHGVPPDAGG